MAKIFHSLRRPFETCAELLSFFRPYRRAQAVLLGISSASLLLGLLNPYLGKLLIDEVITRKSLGVFFLLGCAGAGIYFVVGLLKAWLDLRERRMKLDVRLNLSDKVLGHLQQLPYSFFQDHSTGEHLYRVHHDVNKVADLAVLLPREIVNGFPRLFFTLGIIFFMDWQMACLALALAPLLFIPNWLLLRKALEAWRILTFHSQGLFQFLEERFSHMYLIKAFGREKAELGQYLNRLRENTRLELKTNRLQVLSSFCAGGCGRGLAGIVALFGCFQVMRGRITFGTLGAILLYLQELSELQNVVASFFQNSSMGLVSWRRIEETLKRKPFTASLPSGREKIQDHAEICFKNVCFGYTKNTPVLKGLDLEMPRGFLAFVGPSGCGKTTVLNLLLRLFEPDSGEILVKGWDAKGGDETAFRAHIGAAFQEPFLWDASIEENIRYGKEAATEQEMLAAARLALVDEFVKSFPLGYATVIGERACRISQGQKQKIAIARALVKDPKVLILDEAMSAMDSFSEEKILENLRGHKKDTTVILVSHRLSTVMHADTVYYMKSPEQIHRGTPADLCQDPDFAAFFTGQKA